MFRGHWKGVYKSPDIRTPELRAIGYYDTVRYGRLEEFALLVPENAAVKRVEDKYNIYYLVVTAGGEKYAFRIELGDAEYPSTADVESADYVQKLLKDREIFEKAEPL
jgi:hypothetical protein